MLCSGCSALYGVNPNLKKKNRRMGLISGKKQALYVEVNKRAEAAISSHSATGNFLQYLYSVLVTKNH